MGMFEVVLLNLNLNKDSNLTLNVCPSINIHCNYTYTIHIRVWRFHNSPCTYFQGPFTDKVAKSRMDKNRAMKTHTIKSIIKPSTPPTQARVNYYYYWPYSWFCFIRTSIIVIYSTVTNNHIVCVTIYNWFLISKCRYTCIHTLHTCTHLLILYMYST